MIDKIKSFEIDGNKYTALKVYPKTGRTHQIRVHLSAINHPIVGDPIYLTKHNFEVTNDLFHRLMLHSSSLTVEHPNSSQAVTYTASLPQDFLAVIS